jgi:hypothetical protein
LIVGATMPSPMPKKPWFGTSYSLSSVFHARSYACGSPRPPYSTGPVIQPKPASNFFARHSLATSAARFWALASRNARASASNCSSVMSGIEPTPQSGPGPRNLPRVLPYPRTHRSSPRAAGHRPDGGAVRQVHLCGHVEAVALVQAAGGGTGGLEVAGVARRRPRRRAWCVPGGASRSRLPDGPVGRRSPAGSGAARGDGARTPWPRTRRSDPGHRPAATRSAPCVLVEGRFEPSWQGNQSAAASPGTTVEARRGDRRARP